MGLSCTSTFAALAELVDFLEIVCELSSDRSIIIGSNILISELGYSMDVCFGLYVDLCFSRI